MSLPLEHISASSLNLFLRCPRQWQEQYLRFKRGDSNSSLVIGSAVHLGLSRILKGEDPGSFFEDVITKASDEGQDIIWKDSMASSMLWAEKMLWTYWERVGKHLDVVSTEQEILVEIPGVDIPLLGYVDIQTNRGIIDIKTTGYFRKNPEVNPEWKLQMNIYQLKFTDPGEFHILTRNKTTPLVVPGSQADPLYVAPADPKKTEKFIQQVYEEMLFMYELYGEEHDWRGARTHPWAGKYCSLKGHGCCQD